jgi:hypothetical protein
MSVFQKIMSGKDENKGKGHVPSPQEISQSKYDRLHKKSLAKLKALEGAKSEGKVVKGKDKDSWGLKKDPNRSYYK